MRKALEDIEGSRIPDHLGLAYDAWAPTNVNDGKVSDQERQRWLNDLAEIEISPDYVRSFNRWKESFTDPGDRIAVFTLSSRLLIGHGNASAVDVGLSVHHTWGVPIIPGSALKGLLAHYVDATYGPADMSKYPWEQQGDERARIPYQGVRWKGRQIDCGPGQVYRMLFGAPDALQDVMMREKGFDAGAFAGRVTFHDALYDPHIQAGSDGNKSCKPFAVDVLTVHQKSYYDSCGKDSHMPNDYDSPNPVAFLTVRPKCQFLLALSGPSTWTELAARLLTDALQNWGVGGKTASGYGFGTVGAWSAGKPRPSKIEQVWLELEQKGYSDQELREDIENWLYGSEVRGPLKKILCSKPDAATREQREIVRALGEKLALESAWNDRLKNKKADEKKKARARVMLETWKRLFSQGGGT